MRRASPRLEDDVRGLDVLVDHVAAVDLREGRGQGDGQAQEPGELERSARELGQGFALHLLQQQHRPLADALEGIGADNATRVPQTLQDGNSRR
jgi:hypothetical protein